MSCIDDTSLPAVRTAYEKIVQAEDWDRSFSFGESAVSIVARHFNRAWDSFFVGVVPCPPLGPQGAAKVVGVALAEATEKGFGDEVDSVLESAALCRAFERFDWASAGYQVQKIVCGQQPTIPPAQPPGQPPAKPPAQPPGQPPERPRDVERAQVSVGAGLLVTALGGAAAWAVSRFG